MLLKYKELCIRNAEENDAALLTKWWNDGTVMAHAGFPNGLNTTVQKVRTQLRSDSDETGRRLIIEKAQTPIGEMNYKNIGNHTAEIGIKICDASMQERGYGKILLSIFLKELFAMGYDVIVLDTDLNNKRAQHVYEELGFRKIRINPDAWTNQVGTLCSSVDYEMKRGELNDFSLG